MLKMPTQSLQNTTAMPIHQAPRSTRRAKSAAGERVYAQHAPLRFESGHHASSIRLPAPPANTSDAVLKSRNTFFRAPEPNFPKILQAPAHLDATPEACGKAARPLIDAALAETPAVLVRGASLREPKDFRAFLDGVGYEKEDYVGSFIERKVEDGLYDATANPAYFWLTPHNENVFYDKKPNKIIFGMVQPATEGGGETLLQTNDTLTASVGPDLINHFNANEGVRYTRWYPTPAQKADMVSEAQTLSKQALAMNNDGLKKLAGLKMATANIMPTWQDWLGTEDRDAARAHFENLNLNVQFDEHGGIVAWNTLPTTVPNPQGAPMWLNFADNDGIEPYFRITYGNGNPIPTEVRNQVKEAVLANCTAFPLQQGDVIFFDNVHCQHGRTPFTGKRKLLVEMSK